MSKEIFLYSADNKYQAYVELADNTDRFGCPDHSFFKLIENRNDDKLYLIAEARDGLLETEKDQRIAELEQELAYMTKQAKKFNNEAQKYFEDAYCNDTIYQDKISFAVNQLGKVKERMKKGYHYGIYNQNLIEYIDNQIKQLKEMEGNE